MARHQAILDLAKVIGRVTVEELSTRFGVTPQTIRKDLNDLCEQRLLLRVHGGAVLATGTENVGYDLRRLIAQAEKQAIGRVAAALVPDSASLFINIGTTTEAVAQALLQHQNLLVITNNINVANLMRPYAGIQVIVAGGIVRRQDGGIVGDATVDFIRQFKVDWAIIGTSSINADGDLRDYDPREVQVAQAIIANARRVMLVSDSSKLERNAPERIAHLSQVDIFVTDSCPSASLQRICADNAVLLIETAAGDSGSEVSLYTRFGSQ